MTVWTCGVCNGVFERPGSRVYRFCSKACGGVGRRTPAAERRVMVCEVCSTSFSRKGTKYQRFCSVACRGIGLRPERPSPDELRDMYEVQGLTANDIAAAVGRNAKTAWSWLRAAGIQTRPRGIASAGNWFQSGQPSAFKGRSHTPKTRNVIRAARLADGGVPYMRNGQHWLKGVTGAGHPLWKGGITPERQLFSNSPEWKAAARAVWIRDQCKCRRCGRKPPRKGPKHNRGHVHHIVSFRVRELRLDLGNLILLCAGCHQWVHSRANVLKELVA
jgi:hypothetical protein